MPGAGWTLESRTDVSHWTCMSLILGSPAIRAPLRLALAATLVLATGCREPSDTPPASTSAPPATGADETAFLDALQERTFRFFWERSDPVTGLTPDRWPTESFASIAATGFALTAYPIGVERGWVPREDAARRAAATLRFLRDAPQTDAAAGATGWHGLYYHFLDARTGERFRDVELSTVDTALLLAGALFCQTYFDGEDAVEDSVRAITETLVGRADWRWASPRAPLIGHGWDPENGFLPYDWGGFNEAMIVYLLALGSPEHAVPPEAWEAWCRTYRWGTFGGQEYLGFAPLFGHQYTHVWIDFRGIRDAFGDAHGLDYFENSRRAAQAQYAYATENPSGFRGYGPRLWGLTACDGPVNGEFTVDGRPRRFVTYSARGACFTEVNDDGTVCPSAAAASLPFAPELVMPTLRAMHEDYGDALFGRYGFMDALNPTFRLDVPAQHGRVDPELGWFDTDWLGIDQGPIVAMIENHRSGLVWLTMRRNPHVVRGLRAAGFHGGWLDSLGTAP